MHCVRTRLRLRFQIGLREEESGGGRGRWGNKRVGNLDRQDWIGGTLREQAKITPGTALHPPSHPRAGAPHESQVDRATGASHTTPQLPVSSFSIMSVLRVQ